MPKKAEDGVTRVVFDPQKEIENVADAEAQNFKTTRALLGERTKLSSDVLSLYDAIRKSVPVDEGATDQEQLVLAVMLMLLAGCRFQMTMSVLQNWRGRSTEALIPLRKAAEYCGVACHVKRNPQLADVWSSASESLESYKKHKEAFPPKSIFPNADPIMRRLFQVFDFASKVAHSSIYSLTAHARGGEFLYFDIGNPRDPALIRTFIYTLGAHESILQAFIQSFDTALLNRPRVEGEFRIFAERMQRHRDANRDFAMSDISKEVLDKLKKQPRIG